MQYVYFIVYLLSLGAILAFGVKTQYLRWAPALIAIFILIWADLILTAQALSLFSAIYITSGYVGASLAIGYAPLDLMQAVRDLLQGEKTLATLVLIQFICPRLFNGGGIQWWVSGGLALGYGYTLFTQLREKLSGKK